MAIASIPLPVAADEGLSVEQALQEAETSHDIQLDLPGGDPVEAETSTPEEREAPPIRIEPRRESSTIGAIGEFLFWALAIGLVVLILAYLVRELPYVRDWIARRRARKKEAKPVIETVEAPISPEVARSLLDEADRLAAQGAYAEAVRLLLFRSVEDIARRLGRRVPAALTSREILVTAPMNEPARDAFDDIVSAVELTYFGGRGFTAEDFGRCRQSYERFVVQGAAG